MYKLCTSGSCCAGFLGFPTLKEDKFKLEALPVTYFFFLASYTPFRPRFVMDMFIVEELWGIG